MKLSNCCGVQPRGNGDNDTEDYGICPECHEHCEYEDAEDEFIPCDKCDGHPACEDFGCAIKLGLGNIIRMVILAGVILSSCSPTRLITGPITHASNDTVTVGQHRFKVYSNVPAVGDTVWFQGIRKGRVNSKLIK